MEVTNSISTLTFNQVETGQNQTCQKLQIPESIHASVHDVKLGLFQYLFGEDDIIPGDNSNAWSEFVNLVNLHPTFKIKLARKLEGENLDKVDWKMSDCATGIQFIPEYKTLLTPRYNTMTSLYHEGLMKDLETWVYDRTGITSQPTTSSNRRLSETEEGIEQFSIQRGQFRHDGPRLPEGWEWRRDQNGRTLYIDHNNQLTTFHRPDLESVFANNSQTSNHSQLRQSRNYRRVVSSEDDSQWEGYPTAPEDNDDDDSDDDDISPSAPKESTDDEGLPEGWEMKFTVGGSVFYIDHNTRTTTWQHPRTGQTAPATSGPDTEDSGELQPLPEGWEEKFTDKGKIFFVDHKNKKTTWEDPRFGLESGVCPRYSAQYKRKVEILMDKLESKRCSFKTEIKLRRKMIVEDSFTEIGKIKDNKVLRSKIWIEFIGEKGLDFGGLTREWFELLSTKLFNPYYGLFEYSANDVYTLQINPDSGLCNEHHLQLFRFIGRVVGMAIFHKKLLNVFFVRPFYSMILGGCKGVVGQFNLLTFLMSGRKIGLEDMQYVDEFYYNSLLHILENAPADYGMTFQLSYTRLGETVIEDLLPDGDRIAVTDENKLDYIDRVVQWRFVSRVKVRSLNKPVAPSLLIRSLILQFAFAETNGKLHVWL